MCRIFVSLFVLYRIVQNYFEKQWIVDDLLLIEPCVSGFLNLPNEHNIYLLLEVQYLSLHEPVFFRGKVRISVYWK